MPDTSPHPLSHSSKAQSPSPPASIQTPDAFRDADLVSDPIHAMPRIRSVFDDIPGIETCDWWIPLSENLTRLFGNNAIGFARCVASELSVSAAPMRAVNMLPLFFERLTACDAPVFERIVETFIKAPRPAWEALIALLVHSEAWASHLLRHLEWFPDIIADLQPPVLPSRDDMLRELDAALLHAGNEADAQRILREFKARQTIRILLLDVLRIAPLEEITLAVSDLADSCIHAALSCAAELLKPRYGSFETSDRLPDHPTPAAEKTQGAAQANRFRFTVLALGKLGGRELNYSSDVDLIFVYDGTGSTTDGRANLPAGEYARELGQRIIRLLDKTTADGFVYRVDMRLRPHGESAPLASSRNAFIQYYFNDGRTWERQAMLKARPCAGDKALGADLLDKVTPFIYPKYLSQNQVTQIHELKHLIETRAEQGGHSDNDIKLGAGGIRDIEFILQIAQLIYGGLHPEIRGGNTLEGIRNLARLKIITADEADTLRDTYIFFRHIEHRIQLLHDVQSHRLPDDPAARAELFRRLEPDYLGAPRNRLTNENAVSIFDRQLSQARDKTRKIFFTIFSQENSETSDEDTEFSDLLLFPDGMPELVAPLLKIRGFKNPESAAKSLFRLRRERSRLLASPRARQLFGQLAPKLIRELQHAGDPDESLIRFERVVDSIGARAGIYRLMLEHPRLLTLVVQMCSWSVMLTDILIVHPGMFDEIIELLATNRSLTTDDLRHELDMLLTGGNVGPTLRAFKASHLLRIGCRDLIYESSLEDVGCSLTALAERVLEAQLAESRKTVMAKHGFSEGYVHMPAVLALGKFGGREMNYGSDLDVMFICDPRRHAGMMPEAEYIAIQAEIAQHMIREMGKLTAQGTLYELDVRLRPDGRAGALVTTLDGFITYADSGQLADWERLALTRARFVAGHEHTGERILHAIHSKIFSPIKSPDEEKRLADAVRDMRAKLEQTASSRDIKRGKGGIVDIEFICQFKQLMEAPIFPKLRRTGTLETLRLLAKYKRMDESTATELIQCHRLLRLLENRIRIVHGASDSVLPSDARKRDLLAKRLPDEWEIHSGDELAERYADTAERVRQWFDALVV